MMYVRVTFNLGILSNLKAASHCKNVKKIDITCKGKRKRYALGRPTRLRYYGTLRVPREHGASGKVLNQGML